MKFFIVLFFQLMITVFGQEQLRIDSSTLKVCYTGTVTTVPVDPIACLAGSNEEYACAYGELRCDGRLVCGTPPCHWNCWCKSGYKRNSTGQCVRFCPAIAIKDVKQNQ